MSDSLELLLADGIIEAVVGQLKTGKEAEVWLVQHASQVVAAKLYKERQARNFRNNAGYREGRETRNSRTRRAMEKGSRFGQAAAEEAWKSAEADSLYTLHARGVRVPTPVMFYEGVLLMELVLDAEGQPAPRLVEAPPATPEDARALYLDLRAQVVRMLCADLIHGDLSPYNILMGAAGPTIIDFPQTVAAARNNRAEFYFRRDLDNVRVFLEGFDQSLRGMAGDTGEIWQAYVRRDLTDDFVPSGTWREAPRRHGPPARGGAPGQRDGQPRFPRERPPHQGRRPELQPAAPEQPAAAPVTTAEPIDAAEAELRALEALVLKQGGGERGRPMPARGPQDGRRPHGRPPPGNRHGGNHAPRQGPPRHGGNNGAPQARPQHGGNNGAQRAPQHGGHNGAPQARPQHGDHNGAQRAPQHGGHNGAPRAGAQHGGQPGSSHGRPQHGGHPGSPHAREQHGPNARPPRPPHAAAAPGATSNEHRHGGNPRPPRNDARGGPERRNELRDPRPSAPGSNPGSRGRPPSAKSGMPRRQGAAPQVSYVTRAAPPPKSNS